MAFFGSQLRAFGSRVVMVGVRRSLSLTVKPSIVNTCSPRVGLLCPFTHFNKPFVARAHYLLSKSYSKPIPCSCANCNGVHTKGDKVLVEFLAEEIAAENEAQKSPKLPTVEGFSIATDKAFITLTRKFNNENIKVKFNINHTVDAEMGDGDVNPSQDKVGNSEMASKPNFSVEIEKGGKTLEFGCSIVQDVAPEDANADADLYDVFNIDEISIYEKERNDSSYAVSGEIMDGELYDLLMGYLEERGISNEFAENLIEYATSYEHKQYIGLLENLKSFITSK